MFSILESVAFDTGYSGSAGLVPQSWVNGNGTSYIYYGAGEFDGQGSGDDFWGTVNSLSCSALCSPACIVTLRTSTLHALVHDAKSLFYTIPSLLMQIT